MQTQFDKYPTTKPEKVADAIVRGIRQDRPRVLVGPDTFALDAIVRLLPAAHSRLLAKPVDLLYRREAAAPNEILVGSTTRILSAQVFAFTAVGEMAVKGRSEPVEQRSDPNRGRQRARCPEGLPGPTQSAKIIEGASVLVAHEGRGQLRGQGPRSRARIGG